nr:hypothetical protein [Tanacetum cinerariifolium]
MRTRSSSNLPVESPPNPSTSNPKRRYRRRSKQPFILEESPIDTMADQRTMAELLRAPIEGYAKAIVVPLVLAVQFELKHNLINMMTSDQFFGLEKDNPHDHIRWFNKTTSTIKYKDVPNSAIKLIYKDLLRACPHHGFTELHQFDTFYNTLNPADQDSLNSAAGGNLLERRTQDVLTIIENKSKVRNSRNKSVVSQVKSSDANSSSSSEIAKLTHAVNQQTSAVTTVMTAILKQFQATPPPASVKFVEEIYVTCGGSRSLPSNTIANSKSELKSITPRSGIVLDGPSVPIPPLFINPEEDERVDETLTDQDLAEYTIKVPPPLVQKPKPHSQRNFVMHQRDPLYPMVILKKLPEKLGDPGKFLIPCGFNELKCKALTDLEGGNVLPEKFLDLDSTKYLHPPHHVNPLSGSTTSSSSPNQLLEEFVDELALITFSPGNDDLPFDIEPNLKEIEYLLHHDPIKDIDSILKDSIDQSNLADLNDNLIDSMLEMFTDEDALDYSSPPLYDEYDDDLFEVEYPHLRKPFEGISRVALEKNEKKLAISHASLILEDFDLPLNELPSFKEVLGDETLLSFSSENKEKVFKPKILTSKEVHSFLIP